MSESEVENFLVYLDRRFYSVIACWISVLQFIFILIHPVGVPANHIVFCRFRKQKFSLKTNPFIKTNGSCTGETIVFATGCIVVVANRK